MEIRMNHWKMTAIGMALVIVTALVTGLVVASWRGSDGQRAEAPAGGTASRETLAPPVTTPPSASPKLAADPSAPAPRTASGVPPQSVTQACNQYAARQTGPQPTTQDKVIDVAKDAAIGAVGGAAVGALGGAIAGGGKGAGKGAAIGGVAGAGAGTLYGIYQNRQNDEKYRTAYAGCMRSRGYTS